MSTKKPKEEERYQCCSCKFEWPDFSGPKSCPMCQHSYVKWLSYNEEKYVDQDQTSKTGA